MFVDTLCRSKLVRSEGIWKNEGQVFPKPQTQNKTGAIALFIYAGQGFHFLYIGNSCFILLMLIAKLRPVVHQLSS